MWGLSLVAASGGHSSSPCTGLSLSRPLLLRSTASRRAGSAIVAHGPSCSVACRIFPDQGLNPCPLHWQADSQPLRHQGNPIKEIFKDTYLLCKICSNILPNLKLRVFFVFLLWVLRALYIFWKQIFGYICFVSISSQSVACVFISLIVYLKKLVLNFDGIWFISFF